MFVIGGCECCEWLNRSLRKLNAIASYNSTAQQSGTDRIITEIGNKFKCCKHCLLDPSDDTVITDMMSWCERSEC